MSLQSHAVSREAENSRNAQTQRRKPRRGEARHDSVLKALFDRTGGLMGLVFAAPFMLGIAAILFMKRDGPIFYRHTRIGLGGRPFECLKFRTMVTDGAQQFQELMEIDPIARDDWAVHRKVYRDPRVSRFGSFLRSSSLDELPQFWNVLRGDMSMVGPRPITEEELQEYGEHAADYLSVKPGLTGAWQVNGRSEATYGERVAMDVDYIRNRNLWRDFRIVLETFKVVLRRQGAM